jgi:exopolyphosphatase
MSIAAFVETLHHNLKRLGNKGCALFIVGNEAADLDSCMSSILTAYFCSKALETQKLFTISPSAVLPLINIPRDDLKLRPDVVYLLSELGLPSKSLLFLDDLGAPSVYSNSYAYLVDFNKLTDHLSSIFDNRVVGILDHHDDEGLYNDIISTVNGTRTIAKAGSCMSLVVDHWRKIVGDSEFKTSEVAKLAMAPLLADTANMTHRVEEYDRRSFELLSQAPSLSTSVLYSLLQTHKKNLNGMIPRDILRTDYKQWDSAGNNNLGISSTPQSLEWLYSHHKQFDADIQSWADEKRLSVYAIMTTSKDANNNFQRELAILPNGTNNSDRSEELVNNFLSLFTDQLQLEPKEISSIPEYSKVRVFQQRNVQASRKQVAPLLRQAVHGIQPNNL